MPSKKKKTWLAAVLAMGGLVLKSLSALANSDSDGRVGQYFCVLEYAAGIVESGNDKTFAGKVDIPDSDKKFFVRIKRIERDQTVKELCTATANSFIKAFHEGSDPPHDSSTLYGTSVFEWVCLASYMAEIPMGPSKPNEVWSYRGLNAYRFRGTGEEWFNLYGNGTFSRTFTYDSGPTLQKGRCERIQSK